MMTGNHSEDMAKTTVTTFIEEDVKEGLKALADIERRSMSQMVAILIERAVAEAIKNGTIPDVLNEDKK